MANSNVGRHRMPVEIMQQAGHRGILWGAQGGRGIMDRVKNDVVSLGLDERRLIKDGPAEA
jgi:hypothetical protein